ncbi:MAG: sucrase ferredoxin [Rubrobacteraceae bacterium]
MTLEKETRHENRLCSVVSKAAGDDPGGTAASFDAYLAVELKPPWRRNVVESKHVPRGFLPALQNLLEAGKLGGATALLPDPEYSRTGHTRLLFFERPAGPFAAYDKREHLLPDSELLPFLEALAGPGDLPRFERYRQDTSRVRDILVCTHGARDACCGKFGYPIYETLRGEYAVPDKLHVWRTSHIGGHRFAPTLIDFPEGRYWGHLEPQVLENLVRRTGPTAELYRLCRGWTGVFAPFEQVAEREAFAREGWGWTGYLKEGQTHATAEDGRFAEVRIEYSSPDGAISGAYEATVEVSGGVMTLASSGTDPLEEVPQYRVSRMVKDATGNYGETKGKTRFANGPGGPG